MGDLGLDSLDVVEMVMDAEERFGATLSPTDLDQVRTIEDLLRLIQERRNEAG